MKEKILSVIIKPCPCIKIRVIDPTDSLLVTKSKKKYPFILMNSVEIKITTDKRQVVIPIKKEYVWNGADIPKSLFWVGQSKDNNYLVASMVHDYLLEKKEYIYKELLERAITVSEYRRLTSLIFRQILKDEKTNVIKANVMAWAVDCFQACLIKEWNKLK